MNKRIIHLLSVILLISALLVSCSPPADPLPKPEAVTPVEEQSAAELDPTVTAIPTPIAAETATFALTFNATWSAEMHPADYDTSAHFSPFIAVAHDGTPDGRIFEAGQIASDGMEQMAETGATALLEGEINTIIGADNALGFTKGSRIDSPGSNTSTIATSQVFSKLTFVSMIAPSPDWFVVAEVELFVDGQWVESLELPLLSYDSGTDSGTTLTTADVDTRPREAVTLLGENLQNMGTLTLSRVE